MRKLIFILITICVFSACEKETADINDCYKYLSSLNINDAKSIYQKNSNSSTKRLNSISTWKLDLNGNEVKLQIRDNDGKPHDIGLMTYGNFGNKFLLICPDRYDLYNVAKPDYNTYFNLPASTFAMLVDKETNKMYRWPSELKNIEQLTFKIPQNKFDKFDNIYFAYEECLYKMNSNNLTISKLLSNQKFFDFKFTDDDIILYWEGQIPFNRSYKIKTTQGKIYLASGTVFIVDNQIYSIENDILYIWMRNSANLLDKKVHSKLDLPISHAQVLYNNIRNSVLLLSDENDYEFKDNKLSKLPKLSISYDDYIDNLSQVLTSSALYNYSTTNSMLTRLDFKTNEISTLSMQDYDIQTLTANPNHPNISFSGVRYEDAAYVLGEITPENKINILTTTSEKQEIINIVPIN